MNILCPRSPLIYILKYNSKLPYMHKLYKNACLLLLGEDLRIIKLFL